MSHFVLGRFVEGLPSELAAHALHCRIIISIALIEIDGGERAFEVRICIHFARPASLLLDLLHLAAFLFRKSKG